MTQTLDGDLIRKGDTVYLHCEVKANPAAHTVEWTRDEVNNSFNINAYLVKKSWQEAFKKRYEACMFSLLTRALADDFLLKTPHTTNID